MKRFLLACAFLACFTVGVCALYDFGVLWMMRRSPSCVATKMERAMKGGQGEDLAIFGSSRALGNYVPSLLSTNAFDYGVNGMTLNETLIVVRRYMELNKTATILINLDPWGFESPERVRFVGDYRLAALNAEVRESVLGRGLKWTDWLPGFRFQGALRSSMAEYLNARLAATKQIDCGAELLLNSRTESEWAVISKDIKPWDFKRIEGCDKELDALYSEQGDRKIVWVVSPVAPSKYEKFAGQKGLSEFLSEQASRQNVSVINLLDQQSLIDYPLFADPTHFNVKGAELFTEMLKTRLDGPSRVENFPLES